eukprot:CAMPEP_0183427012 /NCGR_PEP_ID=MMETSP0370-20130417/40031_1 /TAXON_ID=268820 /ORGANISM="Peridinium aciculiferum, Strain PAER-2" /LENGTH=37 /DNA_ID= /DNA_START= /DNA_END= /DNA_ORIENTATION=
MVVQGFADFYEAEMHEWFTATSSALAQAEKCECLLPE